jgi:UDP-N-acetylglucosamine pyrophosphorylase
MLHSTLAIIVMMDQCSVSQSDWEKIQPPSTEQIVPLDQLTDPIIPASLNKLAVLKVNGGLGTSMGKDYDIYISIYQICSQIYVFNRYDGGERCIESQR